jgi:hypothetical protein
MAPGFEPLPLLSILAIGIAIYILPSISAYIMGHKYLARIILVNVFLGWTGIGWIACLIYSMKESHGEATGEEQD